MKRIFINTFYNILGHVFPTLVGLVCIPRIINLLGNERFGFLSLVWVAVGYFSFFDFGLSRAVTKKTIEYLESNDEEKVSVLFWTSFALVFVVSAVASSLLFLFSDVLAEKVFKLSIDNIDDASFSLKILSFILPFVVLLSLMKGFIEAKENFKILNFFQVFLGVYSFLSPIFFFKWHQNLAGVIVGLTIGRGVFFILHFYICFKMYPQIVKFRLDLKELTHIISYGGWLTVSNIIGPIMVYFDRFILSGVVPMKDVVYYTTPQEIMSRLLLLPSSFVRVLFPSFTRSIQKDNFHSEAASLITKSYLVTLVTFIPILLFLNIFSKNILKIWINEEFSFKAHITLQILSMGVFFNSLAQVPFTYLQADGKSHWTAWMHLVELPIYILAFFILSKKYGFEGASWAWSLRTFIDFVILFFLSRFNLTLGKKSSVSKEVY